jgi:serine/threonine protein phosphatase PrpC
MSVKTQSYAASNIGRVRKSNQDSGYAGYNFFFVADGMGGHAGGDIASAIIAQSVAQADREYEDTDQAWDENKNPICYDIPSLWKHVEELRVSSDFQEYVPRKKMSPEDIEATIKQFFK